MHNINYKKSNANGNNGGGLRINLRSSQSKNNPIYTLQSSSMYECAGNKLYTIEK